MNNCKISVVIPVYNEDKIIGEVIARLLEWLNNASFAYELIVVDDGSYDATRKILESIDGIQILTHPYNKGYGAALKTGVKHSTSDWIIFFDGDGQHDPGYIAELIKYFPMYDMVVGAREGYKGPWIRQPGKKALHLLANYLVDFRIADLNSGFRLVKKESFNRFIHLYPDSFSLSTTITLAFIKAGLSVKYVPIHIYKRNDKKSMVRPRHALETFALIIRMIILFSPMKFFIPITLVFSLLAASSFIYDVVHQNLTDTSVVLLIATILFLFLGILIEQVSALRRETGVGNKNCT